MTLAIPIWAIILIACFVGWLLCAIAIGPGDKPTGDYGWDLATPLFQLANLAGWLLGALLFLVLYLLACK